MSAVLKPFVKPFYAESTNYLVNIDHVKAVYAMPLQSGGPVVFTTKYAIRFFYASDAGGIGHTDWVYTTEGDRDAEYATLKGVYGSLISGASTSSTITQ